MRTAAYLTLILIAIHSPAWTAEPSVKTWNLNGPLPEGWSVISGNWQASDGVLQQLTAERDRYILLFDVELIEGIIEVELSSQRSRLASGIVMKWIDSDHHVFLRHGAYDYFTLGGRGNLKNGPFGDFAISTPPTIPGEFLRLKIIMRDKQLIYVVDDVVVAVAKDSLAGMAGRPGLYAEFPTIYRSIKVTRTK